LRYFTRDQKQITPPPSPSTPILTTVVSSQKLLRHHTGRQRRLHCRRFARRRRGTRGDSQLGIILPSEDGNLRPAVSRNVDGHGLWRGRSGGFVRLDAAFFVAGCEGPALVLAFVFCCCCCCGCVVVCGCLRVSE
jgi:hypothetical protein